MAWSHAAKCCFRNTYVARSLRVSICLEFCAVQRLCTGLDYYKVSEPQGHRHAMMTALVKHSLGGGLPKKVQNTRQPGVRPADDGMVCGLHSC